jgi:hypothetical protein
MYKKNYYLKKSDKMLNRENNDREMKMMMGKRWLHLHEETLPKPKSGWNCN